MKKHGLKIFGICASVLLLGCGSTPGYKAVTSEKETVRERNELQNAKMAWLGKYLLEPDARKQTVEILADEPFPSNWSTEDYATFTQMTADIAVGELSSSAGSSLGTVVFALGLLAGDGSKDTASGMYLPSNLNGTELTTPELARQAALQLVTENIYKAAENIGFVVTCIHACNGFSPIYRFDISENADYSLDCFYDCGKETAKYKVLPQPSAGGNFVYQPSPFTITISIGEFEDAGDTRSLDSLSTGFLVKWKSKQTNGALVKYIDNVAVNVDGVIEIMPPKKGTNYSRVNGWDNHVNTPFGRHIHRIILDNPYHFYGSSTNSVFVYNARVYYMTWNSIYNSIDTIVTN